MSQPAPDPGRLSFRVRYLRPPKRALQACEALGIDTVADFCQRSKSDFLAQPNFGERSWKDLSARVESFLDQAGPAPEISPEQLDRPLADLVSNRRALRACHGLKIHTVGEFLATPREQLLTVAGFGERSWWEVHQQLLGQDCESSWAELLPPALLQLHPLQQDPGLREHFPGRANLSLAELVAQPLSHAQRQALRAALQSLLAPLTLRQATRFLPWLREARQRMERPTRQLFDALFGVSRRPLNWIQARTALGMDEEEAQRRIEEARGLMQSGPEDALELWGNALRDDLDILDGVVTPDTLAADSPLRRAAQRCNDPALVLRIVSFCRPDVGHAHGDYVCRLDGESLEKLRVILRAQLNRDDRPIRLQVLRSQLPEEAIPPGSEALLPHLLRHDLHRTVRFDPEQGELVLRPERLFEDRLESLVDEAGQPLRLDDLLFSYRDRHGSGRRDRIVDSLRRESRFLQVGPDLWSLRALHLDELELVRPEAEQIRDRIIRSGMRRPVLDLQHGPDAISERSAYLIVDHLRRDPSLRDLGRGEFCPRTSGGSKLVRQIAADLRRAMGEVPFARFLQNQPPEHRRLTAQLLRMNRLFVSPQKDRVDLAENYPFTGERLRWLLQEARQRIDQAGYAPLSLIMDGVVEAGLGGTFLTDHLLLDLLRRHGGFEILPGPVIADPKLGLTRWIQRTARDVLRANPGGMNPRQLISVRPELAEFERALPDLLDLDPHLVTDDGLSFQLI